MINKTNTTIPYAHVKFTQIEENKNDITFIGLATDSQGNFSIELNLGRYFTEISAIGYKTHTQFITITQDTILSTIVLQENNVLFDEVIIRAKMSTNVKHTARGRNYYISGDSLLNNVSALDAISSLPGIWLGDGGQILLNSESASILINGKPLKSSNVSILEILNEKRGDEIKEIKLIEVPSSKYSTNIKAIIDITFHKQKTNGIRGRSGLVYSNADYNISSNLSFQVKMDKFIISNRNNVNYRKLSRERNTVSSLSNGDLEFDENLMNISTNNSNSHSLGLDYSINKRNSLFGFIGIDNSRSDMMASLLALNANNLGMQESVEELNNISLNKDVLLSEFSYRYDVEKSGFRFDVSLFFERNSSINVEDIEANTFSELNNFQTIEKDNGIGKRKLFSNKIDFYLPILRKSGDIQFGFRYNEVNLDESNEFRIFVENTNDFQDIPQLSNNFEFNEKNFVAYGSVSMNKTRFKYSGGARIEAVNTKSQVLNSELDNQKSFLSILPNISFKYLFDQKGSSSINLSYREGVSLPPYLQLNPFKRYVSSTTNVRGNPDLEKSKYSILSCQITLSDNHYLTASYNSYKDIVYQIVSIEDGKNLISYQNIGNKKSYNFNYSTKFNISKYWRLNFGLNGSYFRVINSDELSRGNSLRINTSQLIRFPKKLIFSLSIDYLVNAGSDGFITSNHPTKFYIGFRGSKTFLNNSLTLKVSLRDILSLYNSQMIEYSSHNTIVTSTSKSQSPKISIAVSYLFNRGSKVSAKSKKNASFGGNRL